MGQVLYFENGRYGLAWLYNDLIAGLPKGKFVDRHYHRSVLIPDPCPDDQRMAGFQRYYLTTRYQAQPA